MSKNRIYLSSCAENIKDIVGWTIIRLICVSGVLSYVSSLLKVKMLCPLSISKSFMIEFWYDTTIFFKSQCTKSTDVGIGGRPLNRNVEKH